MEGSILISTKKVLGIAKEYTAFDEDIVMFINTALSVVAQLGVGPEEGFMIEDDSSLWDELPIPMSWLNVVKTYVYLRVRLLFDPPTTSFGLEAMNNQLAQYEWRLNVMREDVEWTAPS